MKGAENHCSFRYFITFAIDKNVAFLTFVVPIPQDADCEVIDY